MLTSAMFKSIYVDIHKLVYIWDIHDVICYVLPLDSWCNGIREKGITTV